MTDELALPPLPAGIWRHWKGHPYLTIGYARGEQREEPGRLPYEDLTMVIYVGLETDGMTDGRRMMARPARSDSPEVEAWWDMVHPDGSKCLHRQLTSFTCTGDVGQSRGITSFQPRFSYVGQSLVLPGS